MNKGGLRKRLLVSHLGVAVSSLLAIMLLVNIVTTISFGKYTDNQEQTEANRILEDLQESYNSSQANWNKDALMGVAHQAMMRDYVVKIYNDQRQLLWSTNDMGMGMHSSGMMKEKDKVSKNRTTIQKDITIEGRTIGIVEIQGIETAFESQNQQFLRMFNSLLWLAFLLVIVVVYVFSIFIANGMSRPLVRIKQTATQMMKGDLSSRVILSDRNTEIEEVGLALNHLADTLVQEDKLRKHLTADIAHELRTPLATLQSYIEAIQDGVWEATPDNLQICHDQVIRLVQLIRDLENLSTVENPMLQLQKQRVCLNEVLQDAMNTSSGYYSYKNISIEAHADQAVYISGDYARLVQVFTNILNNAYKYTNEGSIRVKITEEQLGAEITIEDTGIGMNAEELPYILERFYRGEKSRNRKTGGSGIGLAIVKAIVDAHGGTVTYQSAIDKGTTCTVYFHE
ncbi:sensor histidine kinase [Paenibacillus sp. CMAA1364]